MLGSGENLYSAKEEAEDAAREEGQRDLSLKLRLYGVVSDQKVWFRYPDIN